VIQPGFSISPARLASPSASAEPRDAGRGESVAGRSDFFPSVIQFSSFNLQFPIEL